jgi:multidrug efflux pump subunit AcrB
LEVTDRIETKLQEMVELKNVYSNSRPGTSIIKIDIKSEYWSDRLPQVWDALRKKIADIEPSLPPVQKPGSDDFAMCSAFSGRQQRRVQLRRVEHVGHAQELSVALRRGSTCGECRRNASSWTFPPPKLPRWG